MTILASDRAYQLAAGIAAMVTRYGGAILDYAYARTAAEMAHANRACNRRYVAVQRLTDALRDCSAAARPAPGEHLGGERLAGAVDALVEAQYAEYERIFTMLAPVSVNGGGAGHLDEQPDPGTSWPVNSGSGS